MKVATSILTADFNNLTFEIESIKSSDYIHLDVMDGHFVPNISFGAPVLKDLKGITKVPLDTHLMIDNPSQYIDDFVKIGSTYITIHVETEDPLKTIKKIKDNGVKAGISLKPGTPIDTLFSLLPWVDLVLVMTVEPGFGGQSFMLDQMDKVKILDALRKKHNYNYVIEIDGGVNDKTISMVHGTGVDIVVSGSYILNQKDREKAILSLK
ncbi:MAG: ribulose-phosphate 3-epimerase [Acholeplasmatales bacterium]|nr:ribulose-phosphate 3-epimerase [Acholeplasmatales bacterium]